MFKLWNDSEEIGEVCIETSSNYITFNAKTYKYLDGVLRVFAGNYENENEILIGVLQPNNGCMYAKKSISKIELKTLGYYPDFPKIFHINHIPRIDRVNIDDKLINKVLPKLCIVEQENYYIFSCSINPHEEFHLSFAFSACEIEKKADNTHIAKIKVKKVEI